MKKIEAIIQPGRFDEVRAALEEAGYPGITVSEVKGHGKQKGLTKSFFGKDVTVSVLPKMKLEIVVTDGEADKTLKAILNGASTGRTGDGKIFVVKIEKAYKISNGEEGDAVVS
jgi:nitrogen regulatory protein P-II 1